MLLMNKQNKLYTKQFYDHPMTDSVSPPAATAEPRTQIFVNFTKLLRKTELPERFRLTDKRGFRPMETRKKFLLPSQPPFINRA